MEEIECVEGEEEITVNVVRANKEAKVAGGGEVRITFPRVDKVVDGRGWRASEQDVEEKGSIEDNLPSRVSLTDVLKQPRGGLLRELGGGSTYIADGDKPQEDTHLEMSSSLHGKNESNDGHLAESNSQECEQDSDPGQHQSSGGCPGGARCIECWL